MGIPPPIYLDTLSMPDTLILMVLALVVFGPRRLPKIGRQLGKLMYEFRKASNDFKFQMEEELRLSEEADRRKREEEDRQRALAAPPPPPVLDPATSQSAETPASSPQPEIAAPVPTESPYSGQSAYPEVAAAQTQPEEISSELSSEPSAPSETPASSESPAPAPEYSAPRIQPPSTGETVAAERPGTQPEQRELFAAPLSDTGVAAEDVTPEAERSEPAAQHAHHNG